MLNNISWQGYWTTLAVLTVLYYGFVFIFIYRRALLQRLNNRLYNSPVTSDHTANALSPQFRDSNANGSQFEEDEPAYLPSVRSLVDEVQALFESTEKNSYSKATLLRSLQGITQKYEGVKGTAYQHSVSSLIIFLAEQHCAFHLSGGDMDRVWL